jgi:hypothetical protein
MSATNRRACTLATINRRVELRRIARSKSAYSGSAISRFGQFRDTLWRQAVAWFDGQLGTGIRRANATRLSGQPIILSNLASKLSHAHCVHHQSHSATPERYLLRLQALVSVRGLLGVNVGLASTLNA